MLGGSVPLRWKRFTVVGIHLSGAATKRTALVRGSFTASQIYSGHTGFLHESLSKKLADWFGSSPALPVMRKSSGIDPLPSPFVVDAQISGLGPESDRDADTRLIEALTDLGQADFYIFDAPLYFPPCVTCVLSCPGIQKCSVAEVMKMNDLWRLMRLKGRKERSPLPYVDRYFDYFARHVLDEHSQLLGHEFESTLGSNRAPLSARAFHLVKRIQMLFPAAFVFETHSCVAARALLSATKPEEGEPEKRVERFQGARSIPHEIDFKGRSLRRPFGGLADRKHLIGALGAQRRLTFGAALHSDLAQDLMQNPEVFFAGISAFMLRSLAAGEIFFQDDFINLPSMDKTFPLLPDQVGHFIMNESMQRGLSEPI